MSKILLADYEKILREYAKQGCDIIVGHGYQFTDASKVVAENFQMFILL